MFRAGKLVVVCDNSKRDFLLFQLINVLSNKIIFSTGVLKLLILFRVQMKVGFKPGCTMVKDFC